MWFWRNVVKTQPLPNTHTHTQASNISIIYEVYSFLCYLDLEKLLTFVKYAVIYFSNMFINFIEKEL